MPSSCSIGEHQRAAIARALVPKPAVVLIDDDEEPAVTPLLTLVNEQS